MSRLPEIPDDPDVDVDIDINDYKIPGAPDAHDDPAKQKSYWDKIWGERGAKSKDPYAYQKLSDKDIPMSEWPKEKSGLPLKRALQNLFH